MDASLEDWLAPASRTEWERSFLASLSAGQIDGYIALERLLLAHGGARLLCAPEPDMAELLAHGAIHDGGALLRPGAPSRCHENAARLYLAEGGAIGTGYGLNDGIWRQHSWWLDPEGRLVETTVIREMYFGITLSGPPARGFAALLLD